ncbi:alpha/beta fold hydrolase [Thalassotalea ponticola]|uniref:alpha/beta hydrolase family protein n=1 Tax=Thalassotalea ponticola TaxID=1523392 RepID=UPI0025B38FC3|nr:alpha/beta fold hydrolase [Thalassotalea ponticola]MDN3651908.1 alpha/beta fold hydrolase [Thalassotalea ponticola]
MTTLAGIFIVLGGIWYGIWGLKDYQVTPEIIEKRYSYQNGSIDMDMVKIDDDQFEFTYTSFDGAKVNGRIAYPKALSANKIPVLLGVHAMGRSENRWWMDSFKERPTLEQTHKITEQALANGFAVIAIDSRNHGKRKELDNSVIDIIDNMHIWGEREPYEQMIIDTVKDHRVLLDWLDQQPQFDQTQTRVAGYSMGGHVALLLAGIDERIEHVLSIVPPYLDDKVAIVAPKNIANGLDIDKVWLVTANDDEYASSEQNSDLFSLFLTEDKKHITFDSGHLLPNGYYQQLSGWYQ